MTIKERATVFAALFGAVVIIGAQFTVALGWMPHILGDELRYARDFRSFESGNGTMEFPNFLFYALTSFGSGLGFEGYVGVKFVNSLLWFLVIFTVVIYVSRVGQLSVVDCMAMLALTASPIAIYAQTNMPESLFMLLVTFAFLWFFYLIDKWGPRYWVSYAVVGGLLGIASLAKIHAIFLVVGIAVWLLVLVKGIPIVNRSALAGLLAMSFLGAKFAVGYVLVGQQAFTVFGQAYESALSRFFQRLFVAMPKESPLSAEVASNVYGATPTDFGQSSAFSSLILPLGMIAAVGILLLFAKKPQWNDLGNLPQSVFDVVVTFMVSVVLLFTFMVSFLGDDHSARMLLRYLEVLLPIGLALFLTQRKTPGPWKPRVAIAGMLILTAWILSYGSSLPDSTFLFSIANMGPLALLPLSSVVLATCWPLISEQTRKIAFSILLITTGVSAFLLQSQADSLAENYKIAANWVNENLDKRLLESTAVLGANSVTNESTIMLIGEFDMQHLVYETGDVIDAQTIPNGFDVLLLLDGIEVTSGEFNQLQGDGFRLAVRNTIPIR